MHKLPAREGDRVPEVSGGDTAWMLVATALVMVMLPGLALFYGGLVRRKNVLSTIMHLDAERLLLQRPDAMLIHIGRIVIGPGARCAAAPDARNRRTRHIVVHRCSLSSPKSLAAKDQR